MSRGAAIDMGDGYVKVWRSLREWEWYSDDRAKVLFLHLLITCNWKEGRWRGQSIPPGSMVISLSKVAAELGWPRSTVNRTLDKLEKSGEVERKADARWTLVTLVNWAKYQDAGTKSERKAERSRNNTGTESGTEVDTIEEGKKERREESSSARKVLFASSKYSNAEAACAELPDLVAKGVDVSAYVEKIRNWSDAQDVRRTERGWLATFRTFYAKDAESGSVSLKSEAKARATGWLTANKS